MDQNKAKRRCPLFDPDNNNDKESCGNCRRWTGKRCRDEAELLHEEQRRYRALDKMMRENRGVRLE